MGFASDVAGRVREFFRRDKETLALQMAKGATSAGYPTQGYDLLQAYGYDVLSDYLKMETDLLSRYIDYEEMDDYPELTSAIDILSDDSSQPDSMLNRSIWVESPDENVKTILDDLFHKTLRLDEELWSIARTLVKYGNDYEEILLTNEGVRGLNYLPPPTVRRIEGPRGELFGFVQDFRGKFGYSPSEFQQILASRAAAVRGGASKTGYGGLEKISAMEDWEVVHMRLQGKQRRSIYGVGFLEGARWIWKRLMMLEDSALVYRLSRVERYAFYVDVGDLPPAEAMAYVNRVRQGHKKTQYFNQQCLTADTCITCLDGVDRSIGELARDYADKTFDVFSFDLAKGKIVPGVASKPRKTGEKVPILRVVLDNGAVIRATENHPFLMRDGTYKPCSDLKRNDSLMPLYMSRGSEGTRGYWLCEDPATSGRSPVHRMVAESIYTEEELQGKHVHHINHNKEDNRPSNLELLTPSEHALEHPERLASARAAFVARVKTDASFAKDIGSRLHTWRSEDVTRMQEVLSKSSKDNWETRKETLQLDWSRFIDFIEDEVVRDPLVVVEELVDRLNANPAFIALYSAMGTTRNSQVTTGTLHAFLRKHGFKGWKDFKTQKCAAAQVINQSYGGAPRPGKTITNHKVISLTFDGYEDVYNLDVAKYHNFALTAGVFVHNTGKLDLKAHMVSQDADLYIPTRKGQDGARVEVLGAPQWQCVVGSTKIPLLDGTEPTIKDLSDRTDPFWVYSIDSAGRIVPGKGHSARMTQEAAEIFEVGLDNGEVVRCTGNHPFMSRDGKWILAENLRPGDSLMPLYRHLSDTAKGDYIRGYERVLDPVSNKYVYTHHRVFESQGNNLKSTWESGSIIHHINHNKLDNTPSNLGAMTRKDHAQEHIDNVERLHTPEVKARAKGEVWRSANQAALEKRWADPENIEVARVRMVERMADKVLRANAAAIISEWNRSEDHKSRIRGSKHPKWNDLDLVGLEYLVLATGARGVHDLVSKGHVSQHIIDRILKAEGLTWTQFAQKNIPNWKPKGRALSGVHDLLTVEILAKKAQEIGGTGIKDFVCRSGLSEAAITKVLKLANIKWKTFAEANLAGYVGTAVRGEKAFRKAATNHKVAFIRKTVDIEPVYCLTVETHGNFAVGQGVVVSNSMNDIIYFKEKMFSVLKVPKAYLGQEEGVAQKSLSALDVRFARSVLRVQRELRNGFSKVARVHLAALGIDPYSVEYDIKMTVPSAIFELAQLEVRNARADLASRMQGFVSSHWLLSNVFGMSDTDIERILIQRGEDQEREQIQMMSGQAKAQLVAQKINPALAPPMPGAPGGPPGAPVDPNAPAPPDGTPASQIITPQGLPGVMSPEEAKASFDKVRAAMGRHNNGSRLPRRGTMTEEELFRHDSPANNKRASDMLEKILKNDRQLAAKLKDVQELLNDLRMSSYQNQQISGSRNK